MDEKIATGDVQARKAYLRTVIDRIEVDDHAVRIIGDKASRAAVIAGQANGAKNVRGFVRKWRTRHDSNV
jgi:site-specific DNA recombinase